MASAENSYLGLALQDAYGTPNTTDADFTYLLFSEGNVAPNNMQIPLDREVGGGALLRNMVKVGVNSGGALTLIPRPNSLGWFLYGVTGGVDTTLNDPAAGYHTHVFTLPTDQFEAPFFTLRGSPGQMWGEQMQDVRVAMTGIEFRGADFVRGAVQFLGGLPAIVSTATWNALTYVDSGPQFLAPYGEIELPESTAISVLAGSFVAISEIPLEEQYVVGSFVPEGLDIVNRSFILNLSIKIDNDYLYRRMSYDPAGGAAWTANIFREADFTLRFGSDAEHYEIDIAANGETGEDANVIWSVEPVTLRASRQIIMNVTGTFVADPLAGDPLTITLINTQEEYDSSSV